MKKREKKKEKSAKQWKERLDKVASDQTARIEKREGNILKRKKGAVAIEAEQVAAGTAEKRPRLAMVMRHQEADKAHEANNGNSGSGASAGGNHGKKPRPGFEGKKVGLLNKKKHGGGAADK